MITAEVILSRVLFISVFTSGFLCFVSGIKRKRSPALGVICLAAALLCTYVSDPFIDRNGFAWSMIRYIVFAGIYFGWSLLFLDIRPRYALYLSGFFVILMGVWLGCVQIAFAFLNVHSTVLLILCTGFCRIVSAVLLPRYFICVEPGRDITIHEIVLGLFPAATCFLADQLLYAFVQQAGIGMPASWRAAVSLLVLFFAASAILVLIHSDRYFRMTSLRTEGEMARRQLEEQYRLFRKEQEANERVRALRHDIMNHLQTIGKMTASGDTGELGRYVSELGSAAEEAQSPAETGNATLDALLLVKAPALSEQRIRLENYLSLKGVDLLGPMDVCTLFGNAIDNAAEAASDDRVTDRYIHISGGVIHDHLLVKISNPYAHDLQPSGDRFRSTKQIDRPHGYGLMNIEKVIASHGGTITYRTDGGVFTMIWTIPIPGRGSPASAADTNGTV